MHDGDRVSCFPRIPRAVGWRESFTWGRAPSYGGEKGKNGAVSRFAGSAVSPKRPELRVRFGLVARIEVVER